MPSLLIAGTLGDQSMQLRCTDTDLEGPEPVTNWILETLGGQPYTLDAMRALAPRLTRLFGDTLQIADVEEIPAPGEPLPEEEGLPAPAEAPSEPEPAAEPLDDAPGQAVEEAV